MARQPIPVTLSVEQRRKLERLWFIYGNNGPKHTPNNHGFIQSIFEHGQDTRHLRLKFTVPTLECAAAVDDILGAEHAHKLAEAMTKGGRK